jgi:hypothetical protein
MTARAVLRTLAFFLAAAHALLAVNPVPAGALLQHSGHFFDLAHRRLGFTPRGRADYLHWKGPDPFALLDGPDSHHWNNLLATPAVNPVSSYFADPPYSEQSNMGGMKPEKLSENAMHGVVAPWGAVSGLSALDLYAMGLIGPEEVPETVLISGATFGPNGYTGGTATPVTIAEIIAANGPRKPSAKDAQHRYKFEIYLLHEDGRDPNPAFIAQARGIQASVIHYFTLATNGRMTVEATR